MSVDSIPPLTDNPKKCEACSAREYCMPRRQPSWSRESPGYGLGGRGMKATEGMFDESVVYVTKQGSQVGTGAVESPSGMSTATR